MNDNDIMNDKFGKVLIEIPEFCVVALIGASGSGKSTFAKQHFKPTETLSSDYFCALVCDDENNQQVTAQAFDALYYIAGKRLELGMTTVIDATNVQKDARDPIIWLAKEYDCHAVAIVLDVPEMTCRERNEQRANRALGSHVIKRQTEQLRRSIRHLKKEGFRYVYVLKGEDEISVAKIVREPLWINKKDETGPFDIIGDIHGCYDELCALLNKLGYAVDGRNHCAASPGNRKAVFLGDLCDRGPKNIEVLRLVMNMVQNGSAYCIAGNHDMKLLRKLRGADVQITHGFDITATQIGDQKGELCEEVKAFLGRLRSHYVFDGGKLVVAHAGLKEKYQGRGSARVRHFCLYGETTGETDDFGLPVRLPWANEYRGKALVVYGHVPTPDVLPVNNTFCIDTGCVFGGRLTALRYPEKEIVQTDAAREYYAPAKPLFASRPTRIQADGSDDELLNIDDVLGLKYISTSLRRSIKINAENSAAALEAMSRFAADPHWLIYLPPTMSPCETSKLPGYLEHPQEAFDYYKKRGVDKVICEQKHMGSRAVIVLCKDDAAAAKRFNAGDGRSGIIYTRSGRPFFDSVETENTILSRLRAALAGAGFWEDFKTDWVCLDTELMPWSAKAQKLLADQYAPVGRAGQSGLSASIGAIENAISTLGAQTDGDVKTDSSTQTNSGVLAENNMQAKSSNLANLAALLQRCQSRAEAIETYTAAYRRYCWDVNSIDDYRIAPFHILATEGKVWSDETHVRHLETIARYITGADPVFMATEHIIVDLTDDNDIASATKWWEEITATGGEGMVVKPCSFIAKKGAEVLQPAVKCRGREYLRIIYGPEYTLAGNLDRLKNRSLSRKRNLALNEFALGIESLERFVNKQPLYRIHKCTFATLALESEPVDPRL